MSALYILHRAANVRRCRRYQDGEGRTTKINPVLKEKKYCENELEELQEKCREQYRKDLKVDLQQAKEMIDKRDETTDSLLTPSLWFWEAPG